MNIGPWQLIIIALVILVLFGRGRISEMMGDFGKGIKSFKKGMADEDGSHSHAGDSTPALPQHNPPRSPEDRSDTVRADAEVTKTQA